MRAILPLWATEVRLSRIYGSLSWYQSRQMNSAKPESSLLRWGSCTLRDVMPTYHQRWNYQYRNCSNTACSHYRRENKAFSAFPSVHRRKDANKFAILNDCVRTLRPYSIGYSLRTQAGTLFAKTSNYSGILLSKQESEASFAKNCFWTTKNCYLHQRGFESICTLGNKFFGQTM